MIIIRIFGKEYPDILIKISKREYLEDIIKGKIYFNKAEYYRKIEIDSSTDSREGKIRIDISQPILNDNPLFDLIAKCSPEEFNLSIKSSQKTPIFCCSILENDMIVSKGAGKFDLSKEYTNEMKKWGNCILVFSLDEFCSKMLKKCTELNINPVIAKIKYDQEENMLSYSKFVQLMKINKYEAFFHKRNAYKNQHEFRVVLGGKDIITNSNHFTLDIGKLETAKIFDLESLDDLGFRIES